MQGRIASLMLVAALGTTAFAQTPDQGRLIASNCASCHGTNGISQGGMPSLNGVDKASIVSMVQDFRSGKKPATIMHQLSKGYTDAEIDAVAAYFAAQKK